MQKQLRSNWMNHSDKAPVTFRFASKGKPFTRAEVVRQVLAERKRKERLATCKEMILVEKNRIAAEKERRAKVLAGIAERIADPKAKIVKQRGGMVVKSRDSKGHFLPAKSL